MHLNYLCNNILICAPGLRMGIGDPAPEDHTDSRARGVPEDRWRGVQRLDTHGLGRHRASRRSAAPRAGMGRTRR